MEKTFFCNLVIDSVLEKKYGSKWDTYINLDQYDREDSRGPVIFELRGYNHIFIYKHYFSFSNKKSTNEIDSNGLINWENVIKSFPKHYYIGCDECIFKHKYMLSKKCDKVFSFNRRACENKNYNEKRRRQLEKVHNEIRGAFGDAFFRM